MTDTPPDIIENLQWVQPPSAGWSWEGWACLTAWSLFFAALGWYLIRRKKRGLEFFAPPPPHEAALRALLECRQNLSEANQVEFVVAVSQVVRSYIQDRFGLRAPHRSTEEFLREVHEGDHLLREHQELLGGFLAGCDLVKFAQKRVVVGQMERMLESARGFVEITIPLRQPQPLNGKAA